MATKAAYIDLTEGSAPATPAAGDVRIYAKTDGDLYQKDDAGTEEALPGGGSGDITADDAWVAKGDLIGGTGENTAGIVSVGANGSHPIADSGETAGIRWIKNNIGATAAPDADNDVDEGYEPGSRWVDTTNDKEYVCLDATDGAAVWTETTQSGGGPPAAVAAKVEKSADQANVGTDAVKLSWNTTIYDTDSLFNDANDRFIVDRDGIWHFGCTVHLDETTSGNPQLQWFVNGSEVRSAAVRDRAPGSDAGFTISEDFDLDNTDYVEVYISSAGASVDVRGGATHSAFWCHLVGTR